MKFVGSNEFYSKIFTMEKWWFPAAKVGDKKGPLIYIGEENGRPTLLIFTNSLKASLFAKNNHIETNEKGEYVISKTPFSVISAIGDYIKLGINEVVIDLRIKLSIERFRRLYFERVKKYNFKQLVKGAEHKGNKIAIGELWTAIFSIKSWYVIADLEKGIVYGTKTKFEKSIFIFLTYDEAIRTLECLNYENNLYDYKIYRYTPEQGYEFLLFMKKEALVNNIILRDEDVYSGTKIKTIEKVREIFNIS